jgi:hypothetical protein
MSKIGMHHPFYDSSLVGFDHIFQKQVYESHYSMRAMLAQGDRSILYHLGMFPNSVLNYCLHCYMKNNSLHCYKFFRNARIT